MKTLNNKRASATKTYLLFVLLGIVAIGIVWAQSVPTQPSEVYVNGAQLMVGSGSNAKPYTIRGVVWDPTASGTGGTLDAPVIGNARWFSGVNEEVEINQSAVPGLPVGDAARSLNLWFRPQDKDGMPHAVFCYGNKEGDDAFYLIWNPDNGGMFRFGCWGGGDRPGAYEGYPAGKTYMVTLTYAGGSADGRARIYINGVLKGEDTRFLHTASTPITIGGGSYENHYAKGMIDEVSLWDKELTQTDIDTLYNGGTGSAVTMGTPNLVGAWPFDGADGTSEPPAGGTTTGYSATLVNSPTWVMGQVGGSGPAYGILSTAAMQYASVSDDPKWNLSGAFSLAVWVNMSSYPQAWWEGAFIAHDEGGGTCPKWIFSYDGSQLIWHLNGYAGNAILTGPTSLALNTWYLVGISRDVNNVYKFWVNGQQVGAAQTDATQIEDANSPLTIGFGEGGSTLDGYLAEPLIFNRELQAGDWTALYNGGAGAKGDIAQSPWNAGLIGGWHFDEGAGTTAVDFSGSGSTGGGVLDLTPQIESIRDLRANTVRITGPALVTADLLDQLYNNGIMAIVTVANSSEEIEGQSYRNVVNTYKNHPAILMWNIGEEWDKDGGGYMGYGDIDSAGSAINIAAYDIKFIDYNHPVATAIAEQSSLPFIAGSLFNIDICGFNAYTIPGGTGVADIINFTPDFSNRPFYLSGLDLDPAGPVDPATRGRVIEESWSQLKPNLSARYSGMLCLGVAVRGFSDLVDEQLQPNEAYTALQQVHANLERPEIVSCEPAIGLAGSWPLIRGFEFGDAQFPGLVFIDGAPWSAEMRSWSDTEVTIMLPQDLAIGDHSMVIQNNTPGLLVPVSDPYRFTVGSMHIDSIDTQGSVEVGQRIVIRASGLVGSSGMVRFTKGEVSVDRDAGSWDPISGEVIFSVPGGLHGGANEIRLVTFGANTSDNFVTVAVKPHVISIDPIKAKVGDSVTITGSSFGDTGVVIELNLGAVAGNPAATNVSESSITFTVPAGAYGAGLPVRVVNDVGTSSEDPVQTFTVKPTADPILTPSGDYVGAEAVISGSGFGANALVYIGGIEASVYPARSDTEITFIIPAGVVSGPNDLFVSETPNNDSDPVTFVIKPHVNVNGISPDPGAAGASIVISGTAFGAGSTVTVGGVAATVQGTPTNTSITCVIPSCGLTAAVNDVKVTSSGQESAAYPFTATFPAPTISGITTSAGVPGDLVTINGTNFNCLRGLSTVKFGTAEADMALAGTSWSNTQIVCKVPNTLAGRYPVTVTTLGGSVTYANRFQVNGPYITYATTYAAAPGTSISLLGTNFGVKDNAKCWIRFTDNGANTVDANTNNFWGNTQVDAMVPNTLPPGTYDVKVTKDNKATWSGPIRFTVVSTAPYITYAGTYAATPGTSISLMGANFGVKDNAKCWIRFTDNGANTVDANTNNQWLNGQVDAMVPNTLPPGTYDVKVTKDNKATWSGPIRFTIYTGTRTNVPSLAWVLIPGTGINHGQAGTKFQLAGSNFGAGDNVIIGGVARAPIVFDASIGLVFTLPLDIGVTAPPNHMPPGAYKLTIETANGVSNGVVFTIDTSSPGLSWALIPGTSTSQGQTGTLIQLGGSNLGIGGTVIIGGVARTPYAWNAATSRYEFTVPLDTGASAPPNHLIPAAYKLTVETGYGVSNGVSFTVTSSNPALSWAYIPATSNAFGPAGCTVQAGGSNLNLGAGVTTVRMGGGVASGISVTELGAAGFKFVVPDTLIPAVYRVTAETAYGVSNGYDFTVQ